LAGWRFGRVTRLARVAVTLGMVVPLALLASLAASHPAEAQRAGARAPAVSPQPPRRPVLAEALAGLTASPAGIDRQPARPAAPPPRPGAAQVPASMVPLVPPTPFAVDLPAFEAPVAGPPGPSGPGSQAALATARPAAPGPVSPVSPGAVAAAVDTALAATAPAPRPAAVAAAVAAALAAPQAAPQAAPGPGPVVAVDPRAVARSLRPVARTSAAQRRFRTAAAAVAATPRGPARAAAVPTLTVPTLTAPTPTAPVRVAAGGGQGAAVAGPSGPGLCGVAGLQGRRLSRIGSSTQGCGIAEPVSVTHVHGIRLTQAATLDCDAARATARWVRDVMVPAVGNRGGGISEIRVAAHYACRPRNNQRGARVSEHGRGRAIDISGYRLANGTQVSVLTDYARGPHSAALRRMRAGACGIFRTTLGPGSDRFHADHFHFDVAQHRGGGTYCR